MGDYQERKPGALYKSWGILNHYGSLREGVENSLQMTLSRQQQYDRLTKSEHMNMTM